MPGVHVCLAGFTLHCRQREGGNSSGKEKEIEREGVREEGGRKRREGGERSEGRALVSSVVVTFLPDARVAMEEIAAALARNSAELTRRQRQAQKERARLRKQREHALLTATIAFCHEPTAGPTIAAATLRKYTGAMDEDVDILTREIETRFLETPVDTLATLSSSPFSRASNPCSRAIRISA